MELYPAMTELLFIFCRCGVCYLFQLHNPPSKGFDVQVQWIFQNGRHIITEKCFTFMRNNLSFDSH